MRLAGALAAALITACAGARGVETYVRPQIAKRAWHELTTPHMRLVTDVALGPARARVRDLEVLYAILSANYALVTPERELPTTRTEVVLLASCADLRALVSNPGMGGFESTAYDFEGTPIIVTCAGRFQDIRSLFIHELAHRLNAHFFGAIPAWLNEGLAMYYEGTVIQDERVILGFPPWEVQWWVNHVVNPPRLGELLRLTSSGFWASNPKGNYLGAWQLVHLLNDTTDDLRTRFLRYLVAIAAGTDPDTAWMNELAPVGSVIEGVYDDYRRRSLKYWQTKPVELPKEAAPVERTLRAGEIHALWASLLLFFDLSRHRSAIAAQLERAAWDDPSWDDSVVRAAVALAGAAGERPEDNLPALFLPRLRKRAAGSPRDAQAALAAVIIETRDLDWILERKRDEKAKDALDRIEPDVHALLQVAATANELNAVAWYDALANKPKAGMAFAIRAIAEDRACAWCFATRAELELELGQATDAVRDVDHAIDMLMERNGVDPALAKRRDRYRAAVGAQK
jgi:hypothetical protein